MQGAQSWRADYERATTKAIELLRQESPMATYYEHTIRDLLIHAQYINEVDDMFQKLGEAGITIPDVLPSGSKESVDRP
jgi:hypothetical protein